MRASMLALAAAMAPTASALAPPAVSLPVIHRGSSEASIPVSRTTPDLRAANFINVGQGSAALFEFDCGLVLVDTSGQTRAAADWQARFAT